MNVSKKRLTLRNWRREMGLPVRGRIPSKLSPLVPKGALRDSPNPGPLAATMRELKKLERAGNETK